MAKRVNGFSQTSLFQTEENDEYLDKKNFEKVSYIFVMVHKFCASRNVDSNSRLELMGWFRYYLKKKSKKSITPETIEQLLKKLEEISSNSDGELNVPLMVKNIRRSMEKGWMSFYSENTGGYVDNISKYTPTSKRINPNLANSRY